MGVLLPSSTGGVTGGSTGGSTGGVIGGVTGGVGSIPAITAPFEKPHPHGRENVF
jgi:hypothetical protein